MTRYSTSICRTSIVKNGLSFFIQSTSRCINKARKVIAAAPIPSTPIWSAKSASLSSRGVLSDSCCRVFLSLFYTVFTPTVNTNIFPVPSTTLVPETKKQLLFLLLSKESFLIVWVSPVIALSSRLSLFDSSTTPSTDIIYPVAIWTTSPTNSS